MILISFCFFLLADVTSAQKGLLADGPQFTMNGQPFTILSGSMHYFRIPRAYWKDRLSALRASGLNTVETYVAWNLHEEYPGEFDYSGDLDVLEFIKVAQTLDLYVIVRPGPYICAEWEFGGLPAWLLSDPSMAVRSRHQGFLNAAERYLSDILTRLRPLQYSQGGPIVAYQVENEYLSYGIDEKYMEWVKGVFQKYSQDTLLFTSDGPYQMERFGRVPLRGVLATANFQGNPERSLQQLKKLQPDKPLMVAEFWAGWFDRWGDKHSKMYEGTFTNIVEKIFQQNASINFYMFHGGTNFGFMNGANADYITNMTYRRHRPTLTSYDYNAPLSEHGEPEPKFSALQRLIKKYHPKNSIYQTPKKLTNQAIGPITFDKFLTLTDLLDKIINPIGQLPRPTFVEYVCKAMKGPCKEPFYGFVAYRHSLSELSKDTNLTLAGVVGDRIQVVVDGQLMTTMYAEWIQKPIVIKIPVKAQNSDLIILVENMGRVNYHQFNNQRKGFNGTITDDSNGKELSPSWQVYDLSLKKPIIEKVTQSTFWRPVNQSSPVKQPAFYYASKTVESITDQFLNFENWNKGVAFVNGFNLGRYWKVGPQKALYLPAPLLSNGNNELLMFELHQPTAPKALLQADPKLE